ncbi:MAG: hypothetical protein LBJ93_01495 [Clostridiales bacterium]|nr:hypothetical protein [Clostridiales bacterium]
MEQFLKGDVFVTAQKLSSFCKLIEMLSIQKKQSIAKAMIEEFSSINTGDELAYKSFLFSLYNSAKILSNHPEMLNAIIILLSNEKALTDIMTYNNEDSR